MKEKMKILIVDDEQDYCEVMEMIFSSHGYQAEVCVNGEEALKRLGEKAFDLVITDLMMPKMDGTQLLQHVKKNYPKTEVIMMTAYGTIEKAVETMKMGAHTYVTKGDDPEKLITEIRLLEESIENVTANQDKIPTSDVREINSRFMLETKSMKYKTVLDMAAKAARSNANILILGESGTGKEVLAQFIHDNSSRRNKRFVNLNCHSIPETMLESELFGHEKGSFTGAIGTRIGRIENADYGTLFLDEIGGTPLSLQTKLLKVIENKTISRVGSNQEIPVDFRLITATNNNLEEDIRQEKFREDLFYRISTIVINVPPLKERKEDLPLLFDHFLHKSHQEQGKQAIRISDSLMKDLLNYDYPGNIRELKNIVDRLVIFSEGGRADFESSLLLNRTAEKGEPGEAEEKTLREIRRDMESRYIQNLIRNYDGDMNRVAEILGITRRQLLNKLTEYGIK